MPKEDEPEQPLSPGEEQRLKAFKFNYEIEALVERGFSTDEAKNIVLLKYTHPDRKNPYIPKEAETSQLPQHEIPEQSPLPGQVAQPPGQPESRRIETSPPETIPKTIPTSTEFSDSFLNRLAKTVRHPLQNKRTIEKSSALALFGIGTLAVVVHGGNPWVDSAITLGVASVAHGAIRGALRLGEIATNKLKRKSE